MGKKTGVHSAPSSPITLDAPEVARLLGVCRQTVSRWARNRVLPRPSIKVGRVVRWSRESIEQFARGGGAAA